MQESDLQIDALDHLTVELRQSHRHWWWLVTKQSTKCCVHSSLNAATLRSGLAPRPAGTYMFATGAPGAARPSPPYEAASGRQASHTWSKLSSPRAVFALGVLF
jgi:hypothetical protein